jgi:2-polyprenyl-3-methyl-5-hydroxy-6-metoxy-1,4-benzoquinol methylase
MSREKDYIAVNKAAWNKQAAIHVKSAFYDMPGFLAGKSSLNDIELELLGDLQGKSIVHLQCHFGQDTISLSRLGATVTGVDFSDTAIEYAREIAAETKANARFNCCDIYVLRPHTCNVISILK